MGFTLLDGLTLANTELLRLTPKLLARKAFSSWQASVRKNDKLPQKITRALTSEPVTHRGLRGRFDNADVASALALVRTILTDADNDGVPLKERLNQLVEMGYDKSDLSNREILKSICQELGFKSPRRLDSIARRLSQKL